MFHSTSYLGVDPEPRPNLSSGHIPGSFSLSFNLFINSHKVGAESPLTSYPSYLSNSYTTLRAPDELSEEITKSLGAEYGKQVLAGARKIVTTCGSGMTAAVLWLGLSSIWEAQQREAPPLAIYDEVCPSCAMYLGGALTPLLKSWTGYAARKESRINKGEE